MAGQQQNVKKTGERGCCRKRLMPRIPVLFVTFFDCAYADHYPVAAARLTCGVWRSLPRKTWRGFGSCGWPGMLWRRTFRCALRLTRLYWFSFFRRYLYPLPFDAVIAAGGRWWRNGCLLRRWVRCMLLTPLRLRYRRDAIFVHHLPAAARCPIAGTSLPRCYMLMPERQRGRFGSHTRTVCWAGSSACYAVA